MSRSPARLPDRKPRPTASRSVAPRQDSPAGLAKDELELRDGRYLLAYRRLTTDTNA
ncbi:MAG TPA: hypothetical protein VGJ79_05610 [Candidatus Dormibacteraeota bacterium]